MASVKTLVPVTLVGAALVGLLAVQVFKPPPELAPVPSVTEARVSQLERQMQDERARADAADAHVRSALAALRADLDAMQAQPQDTRWRAETAALRAQLRALEQLGCWKWGECPR